MHGSSNRGMRYVTSSLELIDHIILALGSSQVSSHAAVKVARHDLSVLPYHVGKSRLGPTPRGCPLDLGSVMAPFTGIQASRGSRGWDAAVAMS
jgi:hypothetical protein